MHVKIVAVTLWSLSRPRCSRHRLLFDLLNIMESTCYLDIVILVELVIQLTVLRFKIEAGCLVRVRDGGLDKSLGCG